MTEESNEIDVLFDLYYDVGARLCERLGCDWKDVKVGETSAVPMNTIPYQKCTRCNESRRDPKWNTNSGTQTTWERGP